jgi:hypothetical protein
MCYPCGAMPDLATIAKQVNQILLPVIGFALVLGLIYVVVVTLSLGSESKVYTFLAFLFVIAVVGGVLAGVQADYGFVINLVRSAGALGFVVMANLAFVVPKSLYSAVSFGLSVVNGVVTFVPRIAVLGSAALMLLTSLFVFEATRLRYLYGICFPVSVLWMFGTALLVGNGFSEVLVPSATPTPDPPDVQPR